jgi:hypothetical protein
VIIKARKFIHFAFFFFNFLDDALLATNVFHWHVNLNNWFLFCIFFSFFSVYYFLSNFLTFLGNFLIFLVIFTDFTQVLVLSFLVDHYANNLMPTVHIRRDITRTTGCKSKLDMLVSPWSITDHQYKLRFSNFLASQYIWHSHLE